MTLEKERLGKEKSFFELCLKVVEETGVALYDLEYVNSSQTLKVFIINRETKTARIEECATVDNALSPFFESEDWIPDGIILEVSSPGMFRKLKTVEHFLDVLKEPIDLVLNREFGKIEGIKNSNLSKSIDKSRKVRGKLIRVDELGINMEIDGHEEFVNYDYIKNANLSPDVNY